MCISLDLTNVQYFVGRLSNVADSLASKSLVKDKKPSDKVAKKMTCALLMNEGLSLLVNKLNKDVILQLCLPTHSSIPDDAETANQCNGVLELCWHCQNKH